MEIFSWNEFINEAKKKKKKKKAKKSSSKKSSSSKSKSGGSKVINNYYSNPYTNLYPRGYYYDTNPGININNNINVGDNNTSVGAGDDAGVGESFVKKFESFDENPSIDIEIGDMVYVDPYGPSTYAFSDGSGEVRRDKPFKPKLYNFNPEGQYEVIYVGNGEVCLYDDDFKVVDLPIDKVSKDKPFEK